MKLTIKEKGKKFIDKLAIKRMNDFTLMSNYRLLVNVMNHGVIYKLSKEEKRKFIIYRGLIFDEVTKRQLLKDR